MARVDHALPECVPNGDQLGAYVHDIRNRLREDIAMGQGLFVRVFLPVKREQADTCQTGSFGGRLRTFCPIWTPLFDLSLLLCAHLTINVFSFGPAATVLTGLFAHMFFMHRCFVITRSYTVLVVCGMGAGLAFSAGIASVVALVQLKYHTCVIFPGFKCPRRQLNIPFLRRLLLAFPRLATWWVT